MPTLPKLLVIVGPTSSGKTELAQKLAKKFHGEIVAADSRTIYRGMDIGTSKPVGSKIKHLLIDVVNPDQVLTLSQYKRLALRAIRSIIRRKRLPMLVGGTGLYVKAIVENLQIPKVPPHTRFRAEMQKKSAAELFELLSSLDPDAALTAGQQNKRRMIRALEVITMSGNKFSQSKKGKPLFDVLELGINLPRAALYHRIDECVDKMMAAGLIGEVKRVRAKKYSPDLPAMSGIGYGEIGEYLNNRLTLNEAISRIKFRTHKYARRQITWFKNDRRIHWLVKAEEAIHLVKNWL